MYDGWVDGFFKQSQPGWEIDKVPGLSLILFVLFEEERQILITGTV